MREKMIVLVLTCLGVAFAQTRDTAAVFGVVLDSQGATIPAATVTISSRNTGQVRTMVTSDTGSYVISSLPVGSYTMSVEHASFRRYERTGLLLQANDNIKV